MLSINSVLTLAAGLLMLAPSAHCGTLMPRQFADVTCSGSGGGNCASGTALTDNTCYDGCQCDNYNNLVCNDADSCTAADITSYCSNACLCEDLSPVKRK